MINNPISADERKDWYRITEQIEGLRATIRTAAENWQRPDWDEVNKQWRAISKSTRDAAEYYPDGN